VSNEQTPIVISAAQLMAEIEQAAMRREEARVLMTLNAYTGQPRKDALADLHEARREHTRLVAELAGLPAREG